MKLKSRKAALYLSMAIVFLMMPILPATVGASTTNELKGKTANVEDNERTASYVENVRSVVASSNDETNHMKKSLFNGKAVASVSPYLEVKASDDESSETVGKLFENSIADVLENDGDWTKISSGNLTGYVRTEVLCFDEEAESVAKLVTSVSAITIKDDVSVYANTTDNAEIINVLEDGAEVTPINYIGEYMAVRLSDETIAYIVKDNVSVEYGFNVGMTNEEEEAILAAKEAARLKAEEDARAAEAARVAAAEAKKAKEEALKQQVLANTQNGTDFTYNPTMVISDDELWLLACIVDWESGWESYEGKLAVANVVLNRVRSSGYANTVSGVVYARGQFGGVLTSSGDISSSFATRLENGPRTTECMEAAMAALSGVNNIEGYTSFISTSSANYSAYPIYTIIGSHCFH